MNKYDVAKVLEEMGSILEIIGDNPFKARAFHRAAEALESVDEDLRTLVQEGRLREIPGVGESIAQKITTLVLTGRLPLYEELKASFPPSLLALLRIPGLQGKKVKVFYDQLGIRTIDDLAAACREGKIAQLPGFGPKSQANILNNIKRLKSYGTRLLWWSAMRLAEPILKELTSLKEVKRVEIAGSLRRKLETVGDLDFIVASSKPSVVISWFARQPWVEEVLAKGSTKCSIRLRKGLQVDLRVVSEKQFPFALLYFTGSKEHNIRLRQRAIDLGMTLSEYGLEPSKSTRKKVSEEEIYEALHLPYIPPELREDRGEIEAAMKGKLPKLIEYEDIRGVFHCHTTESDGHHTLEQMVAAAQEMGLEYIGIADHSKASFQANGMDEDRLFKQIENIRTLNASGRFSTHIFAGLECDILKDGQMDFSNDVLKELDYVVASVHRSFQLDEETMTARLIRAIENPYTTIVGHVTGRLLLKRDPYAVNLSKVIDACIANGKVMELNASPMRLDMDWRYWHQAIEKGLKCSINPDAHSTQEIAFYREGVNMARKGWLEKKHVINTFSLKKTQKFLSR